MKAQNKYEGLEIMGKSIFIDDETHSVTFPYGTTEREIELISWYIFEEGFLEFKKDS